MVKKSFLGSRSRVLAALVAVVMVGLCSSPVLAGATQSAKTVSFTAKFSGKASMLIVNSKVTISSITGSGTNSVFGSSRLSGSGTAAATAQCDPFGGKGSIASGSNKITFTVTQSSATQGCSNGESGPITVTFHGVTKATGGSGKANGAVGSLKFNGTLHLAGTSGSQSGSFTVKLSGKLTLKS
jgi:hypothetical protein